MDPKPLSPTSSEPERPIPADAAMPLAPSPGIPPMPESSALARRESPLLDVFIGPEGVYPGTRWLIYLAMAFVVFQVEGWLMVSLRSHLSVLEWRMTIEASMMLAAILPGFAMAH